MKKNNKNVRELNRLINYAEWHNYKFGYVPEDINESIKEMAQGDKCWEAIAEYENTYR